MKYKKISGGLLSALADLLDEGPVALAEHTTTLGMAPVLGTQKPPRAIVFIHCDAEADLGNLTRVGMKLNQRRGRVRTALLPLSELGSISDSPQVKRLIAARTLRPRMDLALAKVKVPEFKNDTGLTGDGVVVGIVDTGIDASHPDFSGRILRIWDQTISGPGVAEGDYGLELTEALLTASRDVHGHGTHVAGIAAGAGSTYPGVASKADLVVVKTSFEDAHIADAIRYVFRIAEELGKPAVVNLSLGGHYDPHDGTDSLSQIIDDETGPGRIVCCAAGNEGNDDIHGQISLGAPATRTMKFFVPGDEVGFAELNAWYPGTGKLEVSLTAPDGSSTPFQGVISTGNFVKPYTLSGARVIVQTPPKDPENNDHSFNVHIRPVLGGGDIPTGRWELRVKNTAAISGKLHVWTIDDQDAPAVVIQDSHAKDSHKIGSPGTAASAVTVGAYVTRNEWTDSEGNGWQVAEPLHKLAEFSSEGPLRTGAKKPDVTAPGSMIVSCLSADCDAEPWTILDAGHYAEGGTSMACPFISGIVAMLLERRPTMTPAAVKRALKQASRIPGQAAGAFNAKWGYGLLGARRL